MNLTPTVHDIFYNEKLGPLVLSEMNRKDKLAVLVMMNRTHPILVRKYVRMLFSTSWYWGPDQRHKVTGIRQEWSPVTKWGTGGIELEDVLNVDI